MVHNRSSKALKVSHHQAKGGKGIRPEYERGLFFIGVLLADFKAARPTVEDLCMSLDATPDATQHDIC